MQIIREKQYNWEKENQRLNRVSFNTNDVLSLIMNDGTHYNFNRDELKLIVRFFRKIKFENIK